MMRSLMAGAAAVALLTGAAYAQDSTYYNRRTETVTTPFGSSQTTTTITQAPADLPGAPPPMAVGPPPPPMAVAPQPPPVGSAPPPPPVAAVLPPAYEEESADIGEPPPPPGNYDQTITTRRIGSDGVATERTDRYRQNQSFDDSNEELGARTTTTRTRSSSYGPAPVFAPPYRQRTTTTTTTEDDGE